MGKGSKPRPIPDKEKFQENWDSIFKKGNRNENDQSRAGDTGVASKPPRMP